MTALLFSFADPPRRRVSSLLALSAVLALLAALLAACGPGEQPPTRDVYLITVDTLRADRLGAYGHGAAKTPTIDALAARGVLFERAYTPLPRTTPGIASLLTGLRPLGHGSREVGDPVDEGVPLVSEVLQERGWTTLGVVGNAAAGPKQNLGRGFDAIVAGRQALRKADAETLTARALQLVDGAAERLAGDDGRLFLWVHYVDPHFPYRPPKAWRAGVDVEGCFALLEGRWKESHTDVFDDVDGVSSTALESCRALYDAEIAYVDAQIARLFEGLEERGRPVEDALIVFTSDHGENLGERRLFYEHGPHVHDASLRVPLIVAGPGIAPRVDEQLARLEDLVPTVLARLGVPEEERPTVDGIDLAARLGPAPLGIESLRRTPTAPVVLAESGSVLHVRSTRSIVSGRSDAKSCTHGPRFSLCGYPNAGVALFDREADPDLKVDVAEQHPKVFERLKAQRERWPAETARELAVLDGRFKLVATPRREGGWKRSLYDLDDDPGERRDVASSHPEVVERLGARLDAFAEEIGAGQPPEARDDESLATLRALGYVE